MDKLLDCIWYFQQHCKIRNFTNYQTLNVRAVIEFSIEYLAYMNYAQQKRQKNEWNDEVF